MKKRKRKVLIKRKELSSEQRLFLIELGCNMIAQDIFNSHDSDEDVEEFLDRFYGVRK